MAIDIYHSRRGKFKKCEYWLRDERESVGDLSKYVYKTRPQGIFYAQEVNSISKTMGQINNVIAYDENTIAIETTDEVLDLKVGCVVSYCNSIWLVTNLQAELHLKQSEYGGEDRTTIISLRK